GGVFKSVDGGDTWQNASSGLGMLNVRAIVLDPSSPGTLYALSGSGVFKSTNSAASWTTVVLGLFGDATTALAIDPQNPSTLYVASRLPLNVPPIFSFITKVFKSTNGGSSW